MEDLCVDFLVAYRNHWVNETELYFSAVSFLFALMARSFRLCMTTCLYGLQVTVWGPWKVISLEQYNQSRLSSKFSDSFNLLIYHLLSKNKSVYFLWLGESHSSWLTHKSRQVLNLSIETSSIECYMLRVDLGQFYKILYLSRNQAPHNTESSRVGGEKHFVPLKFDS